MVALVANTLPIISIIVLFTVLLFWAKTSNLFPEENNVLSLFIIGCVYDVDNEVVEEFDRFLLLDC